MPVEGENNTGAAGAIGLGIQAPGDAVSRRFFSFDAVARGRRGII
jgi:hypothetical protein